MRVPDAHISDTLRRASDVLYDLSADPDLDGVLPERVRGDLSALQADLADLAEGRFRE